MLAGSILFIVLWGMAFVLALVAATVLLFGREKPQEFVVINQITLEELSGLWEKGGRGTIDIEQLVPLWRNKKENKRQKNYQNYKISGQLNLWRKFASGPFLINSRNKRRCVARY